jgi:hypothetical protein
MLMLVILELIQRTLKLKEKQLTMIPMAPMVLTDTLPQMAS